MFERIIDNCNHGEEFWINDIHSIEVQQEDGTYNLPDCYSLGKLVTEKEILDNPLQAIEVWIGDKDSPDYNDLEDFFDWFVTEHKYSKDAAIIVWTAVIEHYLLIEKAIDNFIQ